MLELGKAYRGLVKLKVLKVKHWTDKTFSFSVERPESLRFRSGEFVMIGLENDETPILRAYSIASPNWSNQLEFYSIKVRDGPLTSRLQNLKVDEHILLRPKPVGTLVLDALLPGKRLILFSTGTGIAPFASLIRDPETYEKFEQIILTQTCREKSELDFGKSLIDEINNDELLSEIVDSKLSMISTTTRESSDHMGRITDWLKTGKFEDFTGLPLNPFSDRVMICGSMEMLKSHKDICNKAELKEGANSNPSHFVIEKAFVE